MTQKYSYVFGLIEVVNKLINEGYPVRRVRPNSKDPRQTVYCFDAEAEGAINRILVELGYK